MRAAATASPLSSPPIAGAAGAIGRGAGRAAGAAVGAGRGVGDGGVAACAGAAGVGAAGAAAVGGADAAGAGILIVGAAVGLGGKLIRTVSFFGCTLAASAGLGGTAPEGVFGMFSAIN
jgi:hypothetical protein